MPIHDWTRVTAGTFHAFHLAWLAELQRSLNSGVLPKGYYAMAEQPVGRIVPDVLTLQSADENAGEPVVWDAGGEGDGGVAVEVSPPRVSVKESVSEANLIAARQRRMEIRHVCGDRIVALIELVSLGNKDGRGAVKAFVDKAADALDQGYHLMVVDLFPPGPFDPDGLHGAIWKRLGGYYNRPDDKPLTLAAYAKGDVVTCYVEPTAVGTPLIDMPLFLDPGHYVNVPLEKTYSAAYEGVPQRWKRVIEGT